MCTVVGSSSSGHILQWDTPIAFKNSMKTSRVNKLLERVMTSVHCQPRNIELSLPEKQRGHVLRDN